MSYKIINVATGEDLELIGKFVDSVKFNTKEDHVPLHDFLFSQEGINFEIVTYGDMTREVVSVFEKYCNAIKEAVTEISGTNYDSPILGKSYIMKYVPGTNISPGYSASRPENVFRSIVKWNDCHEGGSFIFKNYNITEKLIAGDCIIFPETEEFSREFTIVEKKSMFISDFWNAPTGQSPYPGLKYEDIYWGNPLWENT
jgi:hypothetical protein